MEPITVGAVLSAIFAAIKAIPILDKWVSALILAYLRSRYQSMKDEDVAAIHKLITTGDQREVEKLLGYSRAGEPSGMPGAVVVPGLPGVQQPSDPKAG